MTAIERSDAHPPVTDWASDSHSVASAMDDPTLSIPCLRSRVAIGAAAAMPAATLSAWVRTSSKTPKVRPQSWASLALTKRPV